MLKREKMTTLLAFLFLFVGASTNASAATSSMTGSLPRDLTTGAFTIEVTIGAITQTEKEKGDVTDPAGDAERLAARIKLYLNDNSTVLPYAPDPNGTIDFYVREIAAFVEVQEGNLWKHTYTLEVVEATTNALVTAAGTGAVKSVNVKFSYNLGGVEILPLTRNYSIVQDSYVINQAPEFESTAIFGGHRNLTVNWKVEGEVDALEGTTATKKKPTKTLVFLIDSELVTSAALPASKYSGSTTPDTPTTCQLNLTSDDVQDCITCEEGVYLTKSEQEGIFVRDENAAEGQATFINVQNKRRYFAFLQFQPDGIQRSQCVVGIPKANNTMTELNGAGDATVVDFRCFIATAAYGSQMHEDLKYFRKFRDEVLLTSAAGKNLVDLYYRVSPAAAEFIATHSILRTITQYTLYAPLQILKLADPWY